MFPDSKSEVIDFTEIFREKLARIKSNERINAEEEAFHFRKYGISEVRKRAYSIIFLAYPDNSGRDNAVGNLWIEDSYNLQIGHYPHYQIHQLLEEYTKPRQLKTSVISKGELVEDENSKLHILLDSIHTNDLESMRTHLPQRFSQIWGSVINRYNIESILGANFKVEANKLGASDVAGQKRENDYLLQLALERKMIYFQWLRLRLLGQGTKRAGDLGYNSLADEIVARRD